MTDPNQNRYHAALDLLETLLMPGGKARISPYLVPLALGDDKKLIPVYQSLLIDVLRSGFLPGDLVINDHNSPEGLGSIAIADALLAWETASTIFDVESGLKNVGFQPSISGNNISVYDQSLGTRKNYQVSPEEVEKMHRWWQSSIGPTPPNAPNFLLLTMPWAESDQGINDLLDAIPEGGIVAAVTWRERNVHPASLFEWRQKLLQRRDDFVALGPCGQEYGRDLPGVCRQCNHGRSAAIHSAPGNKKSIAIWSYAILIKRKQPVEQITHALVSSSDFESRNHVDLHVRYIGSIREKEVVHDHPDTFNDDPSDDKWHEYLRLCPGQSKLTKLAIDGRAGMAMPRLRYGQWLHLHDAITSRPYEKAPDFGIIQLTDETTLHHFDDLPIDETFLPRYKKANIDEVAYRLFGFAEMWPFQHTVLERILLGKDIFAIAATGGGKSECYILPAMLLPGVTIVISPLKSLMQDQFEQRIRDRYGLDYLTTFINGDVSFYERQGRLRRMVLGHYKLVYVTPEQLERGYVLEAIRQTTQTVGIRFLAMDEAHCISQWGHDFRPSYLNIVERLADYGIRPHKIALTATASPLVRDDVCQELQIDKRSIHDGGDVFIYSANRPELNLVVYRTKDTAEKAQIIVNALRKLRQGSAIVFMPHTGGPLDKPRDYGAPAGYPSTLEYAGMVSPGVSPFVKYLQKHVQEPIATYHGAMENDSGNDMSRDEVITRQSEQRAFMAGKKRIMVATKGFGMGIDKPDIRLVIHRTPPGNLEAYAQEAGRAGRDGKLATVLLLYSEDSPQIQKVSDEYYVPPGKRISSDRQIQSFFIEQRYVRRIDVEAMAAFLRSDHPKRINGRLYFTNDQVMKVFDACEDSPEILGLAQPYEWPQFPLRQPTKYESDDHQQILSTGYIYGKKRDHIGRILKVLFNNRPSLNGEIIPLIRMAHETSIILRQFALYKPREIIISPAYFGIRLREAGIDELELKQLLPRGDRVDITPLAERLGISLREAASMLYDIRSSEGKMVFNNYGRETWKGTLLDLKRIEAPRWVGLNNPYDFHEWRSYAGAFKRAKPKAQKDLDDYFPAWSLNMPTGWEITPGEGLTYPDIKTYIDAFMALHDDRQKNDSANFNFLVERYIGADGKEKTCLRALLLGYLKTGETIVGGNCMGCSVCVPDLHFERYTLEQRKSVVAFLMPDTLDLLQMIEESNRQSPPLETSRKVQAAIDLETQQGRDVVTYLESWLTRLIQDDPEHQGALWMRVWAYQKDFVSVSQSDFVTALGRLAKSTTSPEHLTQLHKVIHGLLDDTDFKRYRKDLLYAAAQIASERRTWADEAAILEQIRDLPGIRRKEERDIVIRLIQIYGGRVEDVTKAAIYATDLLQMPSYSVQEARIAYQALIAQWQWKDIETELASGHRYAPESLLMWLGQNDTSQNREQIIGWMADHPTLLASWPPATIRKAAAHLQPEIERNSQALLAIADGLQQSTTASKKEVADFLLRAWAAGASLSSDQLSLLASQLHNLDKDKTKERLTVRADSADLLTSLWHAYDATTFPFYWLEIFPTATLSAVSPELLEMAWDAYVTNANRDETILSAFVQRFSTKQEAEQVDLLISLVANDFTLALTLLDALWEDDKALPKELADAFFPLVFESALKDEQAIQLLDRLSSTFPMPIDETIRAKCLDCWQLMKSEKALLKSVLSRYVEGGTLVVFTKKWMRDNHQHHRLDMLVLILQDVRSRASRGWLTPVSLEFQALCGAGRFAEAEQIADSYPQLSIRPSNLTASAYLERERKKRPERTADCQEEQKRLWFLFKKT